MNVDGGSRGNPGPAGAGVSITDETGALVHEGAYFLGHQTSNAAEYHALIRALQRIERHAEQTVTVFADSELLVRQITGEYRVKSQKLAKLHEQVQLLLLRIPCWSIRHVPREQNARADELANLAMNQQRDVIVFDVETGQCAGATSPADQTDDPAAAPAELEEPLQTGDEGAAETKVTPQPVARAARVTLAKPPGDDGCCPTGERPCGSFTVDATLPVGLCIHAAHSLLPTILAVLNTDPSEFAAVPTLTVHCMNPGCGATFHVAPVRNSNGASKRPG